MRIQFIAGILIVAVNTAQLAIAAPQQNSTSANTSAQVVNVPSGTMVPLTLVSQIKRKSTKPGSTVRALVAFPVTIGSQLAIPAGTYVEGDITSLTARAKGTHKPDVQIHFTRLLFANGYTVMLAANSTEASLKPSDSYADQSVAETSETAEMDSVGGMSAGESAFMSRAEFIQLPSNPMPPPLPSVGPSKGVVIGSALGGIGAIAVVGILFGSHRRNSDYVLYDAGWQLQMTLQNPLTLQSDQVAAAASKPGN